MYALTPVKAQAVALETQRVWCSLAERLGMFAIKVQWQPTQAVRRASGIPVPGDAAACGFSAETRRPCISTTTATVTEYSTSIPAVVKHTFNVLQAELEDLCFAVLQPVRFRQLRHELDVLWGTGSKSAKPRRRGGSRAGDSSSSSAGDSSGSGSDADTSGAGSMHLSSRGSSSSSGAAATSGGTLSSGQSGDMPAAPRRLFGRAVIRERSKWVRCLR